MKQSLSLALILVLLGITANAENPPVGGMGLYANEWHDYFCAEGAGFYPVEMWVWCIPSVNGQHGVHFDIAYPANVIQSTITWNEDIIGVIPAIPPEDGISIPYISCQWDWHWCMHQLLYVTDPVQTYCEIVPHPDMGAYLFTTCLEGYPTESCYKMVNLYLNYGPMDPACYSCTPPSIASVDAVTPYEIDVSLSKTSYYWGGPHFEAYRLNDPTDSLNTIQVVETTYAIYTVTFEYPMQTDTTYIIRGTNLCDFCGVCATREIEYTHTGGVATLLRSFESSYADGGATITWQMLDIDEGVSFEIRRAHDRSGEFLPIASPEITRSEPTFTFRDVDVEDGGEYRYRIYTVSGEGTRMLLFETDPVMVPARPVTLYQNSPNPFNPATTIRFYLPERAHVTLDVYDVSGRSVATLASGYRDRGAHAVEWNGTDARGGHVASGIYFYRLKAGKETVTKKMVLLK